MLRVPDGEKLSRVPVRPAAVKTLVVAAAVVERDNRFLVTRRMAGTHLEGYWEFPGGKCQEGETVGECLRREIDEELGAAITVGEELLVSTHEYPDRSVELHFLRCDLRSAATPRMGQEMRWIAGEDLATLSFPPADNELIQLLVRTRPR